MMYRVAMLMVLTAVGAAAVISHFQVIGRLPSVQSLVDAVPYAMKMVPYYLKHGNAIPAQPHIPPEVWALYTPRPSDVIVSPAAKSGTTWLLQIAHQLRVRGAEPTWDDQNLVTPWLESAVWFGGLDHLISGEHVANPRVFKSHLPYNKLPNNTKLVVAIRDMDDALVSFHKFWNPMVDTTFVTLNDFINMELLSGRVHRDMYRMVEWWLQRNNPRVKFFFFRDMVENHRWVVEQLAEFMEIPDVDDALIELVVNQSSHKYMSSPQHRHRFKDQMVVDRLRESRRLPPLGDVKLTGKVRKSGGKAGKGGALLTDDQRVALAKAWQHVVKPRTGFDNMEQMRAAWKLEREGQQQQQHVAAA